MSSLAESLNPWSTCRARITRFPSTFFHLNTNRLVSILRAPVHGVRVIILYRTQSASSSLMACWIKSWCCLISSVVSTSSGLSMTFVFAFDFALFLTGNSRTAILSLVRGSSRKYPATSLLMVLTFNPAVHHVVDVWRLAVRRLVQQGHVLLLLQARDTIG